MFRQPADAYWYFKLCGHQDVKFLDGGRKKWELDSRELMADAPSRYAVVHSEVHRQRVGLLDPGVPRESLPRSAPRIEGFAGRLLAPPHVSQEQPQRAAHIPTAASVPWSKAPYHDGTFESVDELKEVYTEVGRLGHGHQRLLPQRRALLAYVVRAQRIARPGERQETTTARGPSTAR